MAIYINYTTIKSGSGADTVVAQATFLVTNFWGLSDIHECLGGLKMPPSFLDKQTTSCNSPQYGLMSLSIYLTALFEMKMAPVDTIWLFLVLT